MCKGDKKVMKSNFNFLIKEFPEYAQLGYLAEKNCYNDSNTSLCKLGMMTESMVNFICTAQNFENLDGSTAEKRINILKRERLITENLCNVLHELRMKRNKAIHENYNSTREVIHLLPLAYQFSVWFFNSYGEMPYEAHTFIMPENGENIDIGNISEVEMSEKELADLTKRKAELLKEVNDAKRIKKIEVAKFDLLKYLAKLGDMEAQEQLVDIYWLNPDYYDVDLALKWAKEAAKNGSEMAVDCLYDYYDFDESNPAEAARWCLYQAEEGNSKYMVKLAQCYLKMGNYNDYRKWLKEASKENNPEAYYIIGEDYKKGYSETFQDDEEAFRWFYRGSQVAPLSKDMDQYQFKCLIELADCYLYGKGIEKNTSEAVQLYILLEEYSNYPSIKNQFYFSRDYLIAKKKIGDCYFNGDGVERDYQKAFEWYQKAAKQGDWDSQKKMSECHYKLTGENVYYQEALDYDIKRYHDGWGGAYSIGEHYYNGDGVQRNYQEAVKWFKRGASDRDDDALLALGKCYCRGIGLKKDYEKAIECYNKVSSCFYCLSKEGLLEVYYKMGDYEKALYYYRETILENDKVDVGFGKRVPRLTKALGDALYAKPRYGNPIELYKDWMEYKGDMCGSQVLERLGDAYFHGSFGLRKDVDEAIKYYKKATKRMKTCNSKILWRIGDIYRVDKGEKSNSEPYYKEAMKIDDKYGYKAKEDLAVMYFYQERYDKALCLFEELIKYDKDIQDKIIGRSRNYYKMYIANVYYEKKEYHKAFSMFIDLYNDNYSSGKLFYFLAECYFNGYGVKRNRLKAKRFYKEASQKNYSKATEKLRSWKIYWI